jgi:hypothetical protein
MYEPPTLGAMRRREWQSTRFGGGINRDHAEIPGEPFPGSSGRCATVLGATSHRLHYNCVLTAVVIGWVVLTWPHFRNALTFSSFLKITVLGLLASACYCAAYVVDIPLLRSSLTNRWRGLRPVLWLAGTVFATRLATYWIADEIYPFVN